MMSDVFRPFLIYLPTMSDDLPYNVQYLGAFLDPSAYSKIGRHLWTFPWSFTKAGLKAQTHSHIYYSDGGIYLFLLGQLFSYDATQYGNTKKKGKHTYEISIGTTGFENLAKASCINFEMHVSPLKMLLLQVQRRENKPGETRRPSRKKAH